MKVIMILFISFVCCNAGYMVPRETASVSITYIQVPEETLLGADIQLRCFFQLPNTDDKSGKLYAVNWYKGIHEFYSYKPGRVPPVQIHPWANLKIEAEIGNHPGSVRIRNIAAEAGGTYKCEVLSESYDTDMQERNMTAVVAPPHGPIVQTNKLHDTSNSDYRPGDKLSATCVLLNTKPKAYLTWHINGEQAPSNYLGKYITEPSVDGYVKSELSLEFTILSSHFIDGKMDLDCSATIGNVYKKTSNLRIIQGTAHVQKKSPQSLPRNNGCSTFVSPSLYSIPIAAALIRFYRR